MFVSHPYSLIRRQSISAARLRLVLMAYDMKLNCQLQRQAVSVRASDHSSLGQRRYPGQLGD